MEESKDLQKLFSFLQGIIYVSISIDIIIFLFLPKGIFPEIITELLTRISALPIYDNILYSKAITLGIIFIVSFGTKAKKQLEIPLFKRIIIPLLIGLIFFFGSTIFYVFDHEYILYEFLELSLFDTFYIVISLFGAVLIHTSLDNISKKIKSSLREDRFNTENESFDQNREFEETQYSVNLPMLFYFKGKIHKGWINILNPFRAILLLGTPGSGKSYSVIIPYIKQLLSKGFSMFIYDFKHPDLGKIAYYHYLKNKKSGKLKNHKFHVINLNDVEYSRRINPLHRKYIKTLADATETSDALLQALRKIDSSTGVDQFFTQSAVNMLSCVIYFLSKHEDGKYSTIPHVLSFLNRTYEEMFEVLYSDPELESLLSPFRSALEKEAFEQLEAQLGTLKINISRLATKETYWVFSGNDFNLKISDPKDPSILVMANDPETQETNSACYSIVLNRLTKLINKKGNLPVALAVDEVPTLYIHRIENLIATARSNMVAILLGLQELTQFKQQYGPKTADTICSVMANIISGQLRNKQSLEWLEKLFGKIKQVKTGMTINSSKPSFSSNDDRDSVIPASKIASLESGQVVAQIAQESKKFEGHNTKSIYNCKINIDSKAVKREEKQYKSLPQYYAFDEGKKDHILRENMAKINNEVGQIIKAFKKEEATT